MNTSISDTANREIFASRILNAPRELVWEAWTKPEHIAKWWGPNGFTNTIDQMEVKAGGLWKFVMHGPNGVDYPNESEFDVVEKPSRLVFHHTCKPYFTATIDLEDMGGKTKLSWRMVFDTVETFEAVKPFAVPGHAQNMEKLQAYVEHMKG